MDVKDKAALRILLYHMKSKAIKRTSFYTTEGGEKRGKRKKLNHIPQALFLLKLVTDKTRAGPLTLFSQLQWVSPAKDNQCYVS